MQKQGSKYGYDVGSQVSLNFTSVVYCKIPNTTAVRLICFGTPQNPDDWRWKWRWWESALSSLPVGGDRQQKNFAMAMLTSYY